MRFYEFAYYNLDYSGLLCTYVTIQGVRQVMEHINNLNGLRYQNSSTKPIKNSFYGFIWKGNLFIPFEKEEKEGNILII